MRASLKFENPSEIEASLTITMKVKHWEVLRDQLIDAFPSWELALQIDYLVEKVKQELAVKDRQP